MKNKYYKIKLEKDITIWAQTQNLNKKEIVKTMLILHNNIYHRIMHANGQIDKRKLKTKEITEEEWNNLHAISIL